MRKNANKRIFALMMSLVMILCLVPVSTISVSAAETECEHKHVVDLFGNGSYKCLDCFESITSNDLPSETEHQHYENRILGTPATCTEPGLTDEIRCLDRTCNEVLVPAEVIPALGHSFDNGVVTVKPTETSAGVRTYTCTACGETKEEAIDYLDHEHSYGEWTVIKKAACLENGQQERSCSCGKTEYATIPATGHIDYVEEAIDPYVSASCTETGLTRGRHCSVCGKITLPQYEIAALGHNYVEGICSRCGDGDESINPVEPTDPEDTTPTDPTPTEPVDPEIPTEANVERISGSDRYATAFAVADEMKEILGVSKFQNVVLADSSSFADALSGSYLAAVKNAPIILVKEKYAGRVCEYLNQNLAEGSTIYILGGEGAMPESILDGIELNSYNKIRLSGEDRYATNLAILKEASIGNRDLLVATGRDFADSLSVSATGMPILLVNSKEGKSLSQDQKEFLANVKGNIYIIGGESAVSAVVAYSGDYPDGLCGGPLAYATGAPLLLTKTGKTEAAAYATSKGITSGYVLGGTNLISDDTVNEIFGG